MTSAASRMSHVIRLLGCLGGDAILSSDTSPVEYMVHTGCCVTHALRLSTLPCTQLSAIEVEVPVQAERSQPNRQGVRAGPRKNPKVTPPPPPQGAGCTSLIAPKHWAPFEREHFLCKVREAE